MTTPDPIASFTVGNSQLPLPNNQTTLTWETTGAASCELSWLEPTTTVTYNGPVPNGRPGNVPIQVTGDAPVNVTVLVDDTFTLTATAGGVAYTQQQGVHLVPKFSAVTNPPVVTGVSPATGDLAGGEQVTITGSGFLGTTGVQFGVVAATVVSAEIDTQITVTTPPGTQPGTVDITVTTLTGTSSVTPMDRFGYTSQGLPVVSGVSPETGNPAGGDTATISGSGFGTVLTGVGVSFGGAAATVMAVIDSQITVTTPLTPFSGVSGTGVVDVTVTTSAGTSAATAADRFTYTLPGFPMVTGVSPVSGVAGGDPDGGDLVTISGSGFTGVTAVTFGGTPGMVTNSSDTQLTVITPLGAENSTVDVVVQVPAGDSPVVPASLFTYAAVPKDVVPKQIFRIIWSCPTGSAPYLTWGVSGGGVSVTAAGQTIQEGDYLPTDSGWASATITALTTFTLQLTYGTSPAGSRQVSVQQLTFGGFSHKEPHEVDYGTGAQYVLFEWNATNAAELSLTNTSMTGGPVTEEPPPPANTTSYLAELPLSGFPPGTMTYTLAASGADSSGNYITESESAKVEPYPVEITEFWVGPWAVDPGTGQQSVMVNWQLEYATSVTLTSGATTLHPGIHDTSARVPLPLPPRPPPPPPTTQITYPVNLSARGYVKPGVPSTASADVAALEVRLSSFSATPYPRNGIVVLSWTASNATWFVLSYAGVEEGHPPSTTSIQKPMPTADTAYLLTAYGYPTGPPWPFLKAFVKVSKEKEHGYKEGLAEKNLPEYPRAMPLPDATPAGSAGPATPVGTQQAFLTPDERPDVGAHLRDPDPAG